MSSLKLCFISSEVAPLAKTGGLADVSAALPGYLDRTGHDVRVFMPLYSRIDTDALEMYPVEFLRDVAVRFDRRVVTFSAYTARLPGSGLGIYLIDCPELYRREGIYTSDPDEHLRFALLSRAAIESCQRMAFDPDVFHCNDWHAALVPLYLKTLYGWDSLFGRSKTVLTIHNIGYQGVFSSEIVPELGLAPFASLLHNEDLEAGRVNFLKTGILYADVLTTVSPTYAREIQSEPFGMGLDGMLRARRNSLVGILNGVDYDVWNPETDPKIACRYSSRTLQGKGKNKKRLMRELGLAYDRRAPLIGIVSRLTPQKGFELAYDVLPAFLAEHDIRLATLGSGDERDEVYFTKLQQAFPGKVCFYRGYHDELAHLIEAGADMFLMPSRYEPCGLNQMFSLRYGTVPIVRGTGGLADSVEQFDPDTGEGTGFVFEHYTADGLFRALALALRVFADRKLWLRLMKNGMERDFSWDRQGLQYVELYQRLTGR